MNAFPLRANFTRQEIADACRRWGSQAGPLPAGVDGTQLLWGLSGVESSFGANCQPRHEPAFDGGGAYATHYPMPILLSKYGAGGACSYGPWQIMLCNAPLSHGPSNFDSLALAGQDSLAYLNALLRHWLPQSLAEIGECWNAGHVTPDPGYVAKLAAAYATPILPALGAA
jgi:hypothetical protein